ncbi:MAG: hypothetical protein HYX84_01245 [Chloroflexi bacterium]|nr:hypothetical protein [Chloroflexota bacterium]
MPFSARPVVDAVIVDDGRLRACEAACGVDWSAPEAIALAERQILDRLGPGVRLCYLDVAQDDDKVEALPLEKIVSAGGLWFPLLIINGRLKISGGFDYRQLLEAIEAETDIGGMP